MTLFRSLARIAFRAVGAAPARMREAQPADRNIAHRRIIGAGDVEQAFEARQLDVELRDIGAVGGAVIELARRDGKRVVEGKRVSGRVDLGGRRLFKKIKLNEAQ